MSESACVVNPTVLQKEQEQLTVIVGAASAVLFVALTFVCNRRNSALQKELTESKLRESERERSLQEDELKYLRNWRIPESSLDLEEVVARGGEGEVWRATLHGMEGKVAVKRLYRKMEEAERAPVTCRRYPLYMYV